MEDIKKLSDEELFYKFHTEGDETARNELLERYLYITKIIAKKFTGRGIDYEDLLQTASLALVHAIERFDPTRGIKFNSFATPSLIGEIKNYFRDTFRLIRVPRADGALLKKMNEAISDYVSLNGETPPASYLAKALDVKEEKVLELLEMKRAGNVLSLDAAYSDENDADMLETVGSDDGGFGALENREFFKYCLSLLDENEKKLIIARFVHKRSQSDVAKMLGVSQMQISRMERKILNKLKTKL